MIEAIVNYFDKLEDKVRAKLSHTSIFYAMIGGTCTVIFWRGIWHTADLLHSYGGIWSIIFNDQVTIIWAVIILLMTGLFVSNFIGERIIISGLKNEKKVTERTENEVRKDDLKIDELTEKVAQLSKDIKEIKDVLLKK